MTGGTRREFQGLRHNFSTQTSLGGLELPQLLLVQDSYSQFEGLFDAAGLSAFGE
jgi:hypothetical protein